MYNLSVLFPCLCRVINPYQMKKYGDVEIHKAKTDKKDAIRIATYGVLVNFFMKLLKRDIQ